MVLAASYMVEEGGTSQSNYFIRLREVLALPTNSSHPRPLDMEPGDEVPLWDEWALWLQENGFLPSAYPGPEGSAMRYINYPISQSLLRRSDRERLRRLFVEKHMSQDLDVETLFMQIQREKLNLTQHLRELLDSQGQRRQAVAEVIYDGYENWYTDPSLNRDAIESLHTPHLSIGLYRTEDYFSGHIQYFLYPHQPRRHRAEQLRFWFSETLHTLRSERPGWYSPIGPIGGKELDQGARYPIEQPADFDAFVLLQRQFW